jgi:hypothetical protein
MATITFALAFPGGVPMSHAKVEVEFLTGDGSGGFTSGEEIVGKRKFHTEDDGTYTLTDVVPCAGDMEGGVYRIWVEGRHIRDIQPLTDSTWSWLDPAIKAPGGPGVQYVQGAPGGSGYIDTLANLTTILAAAPDNTYGSATDDNGGTLYAVDGGVMTQMAPSVADVGGVQLAKAEPASTPAGVAVNAASTWFPLAGMTTSAFTMPDRPVTWMTSEIFTSGAAADVTPSATVLGVQYTTNAGASWTTAASPYRATSNIFFDIFIPAVGSLAPSARSAITPGATVQMRLAVQRGDTDKTLTVVVSTAAGSELAPSLRVLAL